MFVFNQALLFNPYSKSTQPIYPIFGIDFHFFTSRTGGVGSKYNPQDPLSGYKAFICLGYPQDPDWSPPHYPSVHDRPVPFQGEPTIGGLRHLLIEYIRRKANCVRCCCSIMWYEGDGLKDNDQILTEGP